MGKKKPQSWGRWSFSSTGEAVEAVRAELEPFGFYTVFDSPMLVSLIAEKHYFCGPNDIRPGRFRKVPGPSPKAYAFQSDFPSEGIGWREVSWTKCLRPRRDQWFEVVVRAMRDRIKDIKIRYRKEHPVCEVCEVAPSEEVDHKRPTFREIERMVRNEVTDEEIDDCVKDWDWRKVENFQLPRDHRVTMIFDKIHDRAVLMAVCREHHDRSRNRS